MEPQIDEELAAQLKALRQERGLSQDYVARWLGKSKQWLSRIENGKLFLQDKYKDAYLEILSVGVAGQILDGCDIPWSEALPLYAQDGASIVKVDDAESYRTREEGIGVAPLSERVDVIAKLRKPGSALSTMPAPGGRRYVLVPYVLRIPPGKETDKHFHTTSKEVGFVLEGRLVMHIETDNDTKPDTLEAGAAYQIEATVPHWAVNTGDAEAKLVVIRVEMVPYSSRRPGASDASTSIKGLPRRVLCAEAGRHSVRLLRATLPPNTQGSGIAFHRHNWSEELLIVTQGALEVYTQSPDVSDTGAEPPESEPPKGVTYIQNAVDELPALSAMHFDGRISHKVRNRSDREPAEYFIVHCIDSHHLQETIVERLL